jgi:transposase-like protein
MTTVRSRVFSGFPLVWVSRAGYLGNQLKHGEIAMLDERSRNEADRLYWESDASVADIAEQLEISRRALYEAIRPRPAGLACEECGGDLVFRNRTSAERNVAECLQCEREVAVEAVRPDGSDPEPQVEQEREAARLSPMARRHPEGGGNGAFISASLLAGMAIGAASAYLFRRR